MSSLQDYLDNYTANNRLGFMNLCLTKYQFHKYKLSVKNEDIDDSDRIVQNTNEDKNLRSDIQTIIYSGTCSKEKFTNIFNRLTQDQILYIGY